MWPPQPSSNAVANALSQQQRQHQARPHYFSADLLAHKYRPISVDKLTCHREQARRLRQWILDFTNAPRNDSRHGSQSSSDSDYDDEGAMSDDSNASDQMARRCVLLTGPPGIGKTSLVYMIASELRMHIVEAHSSERRDFRLFKTLNLTNQKGKINPIAKLFQISQQKQQQQKNNNNQQFQYESKRKRRKTEETTKVDTLQLGTNNQCLSLSGGSSIVLFDDIDVVFDDDGPFLKSLAEFIKDSKRPVIVTATRFIENIKSTLVHFEHIQLNRPHLESCAMMLWDVCCKEKYLGLDELAKCRIIAKKLNCDIRQCLNRVHFYGCQGYAYTSKAFKDIESDTNDIVTITPNFSRLSGHLEDLAFLLEEEEEKTDIEGSDVDDDDELTIRAPLQEAQDDAKTTLACYDTISLLDLMDRAFDLVDRSTLLTRYLDGKPSHRYRSQCYENDLGEQIRKSVVELTQSLHQRDLMATDEHKTPDGALDHCFVRSLRFRRPCRGPKGVPTYCI